MSARIAMIGAGAVAARHVRVLTGLGARVVGVADPVPAAAERLAADGEWTRRRVGSPAAIGKLARELRLPVYEAGVVGYPQRMRDWNARRKRESGL